MIDLTIPAHYLGSSTYTLSAIVRDGSLFLKRSWEGSDWIEVHDMRGDAVGDEMLIQVNADLKNGPPLYAFMSSDDYDRLRKLKPV